MVSTARVQGGDVSEVDLVSRDGVNAVIADGASGNISIRLHYNGPLRAPIEQGEEVAQLEVMVDGMPTSKIPLVAGRDVARASGLDRVFNGIAGWFW